MKKHTKCTNFFTHWTSKLLIHASRKIFQTGKGESLFRLQYFAQQMVLLLLVCERECVCVCVCVRESGSATKYSSPGFFLQEQAVFVKTGRLGAYSWFTQTGWLVRLAFRCFEFITGVCLVMERERERERERELCKHYHHLTHISWR